MEKTGAGIRPASNLKAPPVYLIIVTQFLVSVLMASVIWLLLDVVAAYSVLIGGLISTIPNGYFARKAFQYRGASYTPEIVKSFYAGEAGKLIMTAAMFALVFAGIKPLNALAVILTYIVVIVVGLITTAVVNTRSRNGQNSKTN